MHVIEFDSEINSTNSFLQQIMCVAQDENEYN